MKILNDFGRDEYAAVTVDWVVLTAAVVTIALGVVITVQSALETSAASITAGVTTAISGVLP